jgi:ATP-dependent RNA helicase HrpA
MSVGRASGPDAWRALLKEQFNRLDGVLLRDQPRLERRLQRLASSAHGHGRDLDELVRIARAVDVSQRRAEARLEPVLRLDVDRGLPIAAHGEELLAALERHPVIVVCGATGSGKSTQLPKLCLAAGRGHRGLIGHTQPRRVAVRALADRLAFETGTSVGGAIGYQVRFTDRTGPELRVKIMTDGILLKELERDRQLHNYDTIIVDEAHERSLNIDFLLGVLKRLTAARPELRVIVTSATIEPARFADFFRGAPVIEVSGRSFPVEVRYRPLTAADAEDLQDELTLAEGVVAALHELYSTATSGTGDTLVFLSGEQQIRETAAAISRARLHGVEVLPLYARQSAAEQQRVFAAHTQRRVVLATNVAETSLTVPGVRYVIDSGLARISRYSPRARIERLPIEPVSRASAEQRSGRCGREAPGICVRLYAEEDFAARSAYTEAEILRTSLASVLLRMAALRLGDPLDFPFLEPPDGRLIADGYRLLEELDAMDAEQRITALGLELASFPIDPRLARILIEARRRHCLRDALAITAFLAVPDPRERRDDPSGDRGTTPASDETGWRTDPRSDFLTVIDLWRAWHRESSTSGGSALRRWCRSKALSYVRMREWEDLEKQLRSALTESRAHRHDEPADATAIHRSVLSGFLDQVGRLDERREYLGPRGIRFVIAPGTALANRPPRWVVAASLIETSRLYARMLASVEPDWIEAAAHRRVKRSVSEPHWLPSKGYVGAWETVAYHGLVLNPRRRINFASVDAAEARRLFVMHALVERDSRLRGDFLAANAQLERRVEHFEARLRCRDVLASEPVRAQFYLERIPADISNVVAFERWYRQAAHATPQLLYMQLSDVVAREVSGAELAGLPERLSLAGNELELAYRFEPGEPDDGVSVQVPLLLLPALEARRIAWLVPGLLLEKLTTLMRSLPKAVRRKLVPVPEQARAALAELDRDRDFYEELADWVTRRSGVPVNAEEVGAIALPDHLRLRIVAIDERGRALAADRELARLKATLRRSSVSLQATASTAAVTQTRIWDFGELPESADVQHGGVTLRVYPTLEDTGDAVRRVDLTDPVGAEQALRQGVLRLAILSLPQQFKYVVKAFADHREIVLLASGLEATRPIPQRLAEYCFRECFVPDEMRPPRCASEFESRLGTGRANIGQTIDATSAAVVGILRELRGIHRSLASLEGPAYAPARADIGGQLARLVSGDFPAGEHRWPLPDLARYLTAVARRLERLRAAPERDLQLLARVAPFLSARAALEQSARALGVHSPALDVLATLIEEYRVSIFAQSLGTAVPVSEKRLAAQLERARAEAGATM